MSEVDEVYPTVMTLGQAAGTAAALAVSEGVRPRDVRATTLRARLERDGVDLRRNPVAAG